MTLEHSIVESFVRNHPADAARVLERESRDHRLERVRELEPAAAARALGAMVPSVAAECLAGLPRERAAATLRDLPPAEAADRLRRVPPEARSEMLALLDAPAAAPIERLLRFPEGTAGALMEPRVDAFRESDRIEDVVMRLRDRSTALRHYVYVVNDSHELVGTLSVRELVSTRPDARLGEVMTKPVIALAARTPRAAIASHPGWQGLHQLPVVDRQGRLVGLFRYQAFRELQANQAPGDDTASTVGLALALGELFWYGASGMVRGLEQRSDD